MFAKNNQRNKKILAIYKSGKTFQEIGSIFSITRQRAQQIAFAELEKEIAKEKGLNYRTMLDNKANNSFAKEAHKLVKAILKSREKLIIQKRRKKAMEKIQAKMKLLPHYSNFSSLESYSDALHNKEETLKKHFPHIAKELLGKSFKKNKQ